MKAVVAPGSPTPPHVLAAWHTWAASCRGEILIEGAIEPRLRDALRSDSATVRSVAKLVPTEPIVPRG
jgi:hypothetical protein